jgi:hypothetical protein
MPIFGQVWLWSSLAFLLGALLCWLLVARPARSRVSELENQLATRARRQPSAERAAESGRREDDAEADFARGMTPGLGDGPVDESSEYLTRAYALPRDSAPMLSPLSPPSHPSPLSGDRGRLAPYGEPEPFTEQQRRFEPELSEPFQSAEPSQPFSAFGGGLAAPPEPDVTDTELADPPQPTAAATQYIDVSAGSLSAPPEVPAMSAPPSDRGWFDDELEGDAADQAPEDQPAVPRNRHVMAAPESEDVDGRLVDDEIGTVLDDEPQRAAPRPDLEDDNGGTVFTQRTRPIPGELIRQIDEAGQEEAARSEQSDSFVDDLAEDGEPDRRERTVESEPVAPVAGVSHSLVEPEPEAVSPPELPAEQTEVVSAVRSTASELPRRVPAKSKMTPGVAVRVEPTPNALPKRVPGKPRHQVPFGVEPEAQEPAPVAAAPSFADAAQEAPQVPETSRSLFEPIVPADEGAAVPPPPHRLRQANGSGGRGPFGPGSAMPLAGGASPSPEFTIKASVAALRYCTPESAQFGRTVAEVWFRTAADAERVGFRPVG